MSPGWDLSVGGSYASKKQEFLETLPSKVQLCREFLASTENARHVLQLQKDITAQREVHI